MTPDVKYEITLCQEFFVFRQFEGKYIYKFSIANERNKLLKL